MSSIFVQIPAYHDFELFRTIKDCYEKSSGKNKKPRAFMFNFKMAIKS